LAADQLTNLLTPEDKAMTTHLGTVDETCESHGCAGCPQIDSFTPRETLEALGRFVHEHLSTIENALGNQARRMTDAAEDATIGLSYRRAFAESAQEAKSVLTTLAVLSETIAEAMDEDYANQG
jgi:hypothetical protein